MDASIAWEETDDAADDDEPGNEELADAEVEDIAARRLKH